MLVIACTSGLGNQMFQYAYYLNQKNKFKNEDVKFDINWFNENNAHNGFELEKVFDLKIDYANLSDIRKSGKAINILDKIKNKILFKKKPWYSPEPKYAITYIPELCNNKEGYFLGFWQSEKYFKNISDKIRNQFNFKTPLDYKNVLLAEDIKNNNSISIHVRRGDYLEPQNKLFQICKIDYYKNAIKYMEQYVDNPKYYIFSNDIDWCKNNFKLKNVVYVDWNIGPDSYKDMQLMSCCKHNIIANSSFSWWGAWLNDNPDKIVCVPEKWFDLPGCETRDICPDKWIRIKIK